MKTTDEIIGILKQFKPIAERKYGLTRIDLFGSVAWGEQHDGSDVDVCYEGRIPTLLILDRCKRSWNSSSDVLLIWLGSGNR